MKLFDLFKKKLLPKPGEIWGSVKPGEHPWDEGYTVRVRVIDVKDGWVKFNRDIDYGTYYQTTNFNRMKDFLYSYPTKLEESKPQNLETSIPE